MRTTVDKTIGAIVVRSKGVRWQAGSKGLALIREQDGYVLVGDLRPGDNALGAPLVMPCEDGKPMQDGYTLTLSECEQAVRSILGV